MFRSTNEVNKNPSHFCPKIDLMQHPVAPIFSTLLENLSEGIIYQNLSGEIIYSNPAVAQILGLKHSQLTGRKIEDLFSKSIREDYSDFPTDKHPAVTALKNSEMQDDVIMGVKGVNNQIIWIKVNSHPILNDDGKIEGVITSFTNITQEILAAKRLKKLQQDQEAILSNIQEGLYLLDHEYRIIIINTAANRIYHRLSNKTLKPGDIIIDLFPPERHDFIKANFEKAINGQNVEYEVLYKAGDEDIWLRVTYNPVFTKTGEVLYICVGVHDITKRKQAEVALLNSENRFRQTLLTLGDNAWEHNFITSVTTFSTGVEELIAFSDEPGINRQKVWLDSIHEEDIWLVSNLTTDYLSGKISSHALEYRLKYKDGSVKWILDRGIVIERDAESKPIRAIGTRSDISERKKIEEVIIENERKFRAIFNSTFQFIGLMSVEGILLEANQTAIDFFQIPKEEIIGMNFVDSRWFSEATRKKAKKAVTKAAKGETVNFELYLTLLNGQELVIDFSLRPIFDIAGNVTLLIPEGRDITEKIKMEKEMEQQIISRQKEILNAGISGQEKQRREVARELHDNVNQILATIKVYLQLANENENLRQSLINKSYENVSYAIEEVRKLSKALAPPTLDDETLIEAIDQMVKDMTLSMLFEISFSHKKFKEDLLNNEEKMTIYRIAQEQLTNILKYAGAKKIEIVLSTTKTEVTLKISDNGIGFDISLRTPGTGIRNMMNRVESHNGKFNITTSPGSGCCLQVSLPLTQNNAI
jgi:PAS domain S-box-containing protein